MLDWELDWELSGWELSVYHRGVPSCHVLDWKLNLRGRTMPLRHMLDWVVCLPSGSAIMSRVGLGVESKRSDHAIMSHVGLAVIFTGSYVTCLTGSRQSSDAITSHVGFALGLPVMAANAMTAVFVTPPIAPRATVETSAWLKTLLNT